MYQKIDVKYLKFCGPIIRFYREEQQIDMKTVCIQTGIQRPQYIEIEKGKKEVLLSTWKKICDEVGIDFVALFKHEDDYKNLYKEAFHALLYDDKEEQTRIINILKTEKIVKSIMLPKFALIRFVYEVMNDRPISPKLLKSMEYFQEAFDVEELCLYYDYYGVYLQKEKRYEEAKVWYQKAEELPTISHKALVYYHKGVLVYTLNHPLLALQYLKKAYKLFEKTWNINRLLYTQGSVAACYIRMSEFQVANDLLTETLRLAKQYKNMQAIRTTYHDLAFNALKMREYEPCIQYATQALEAKASSDDLYFYLAYACLQMGKEEETKFWIEKGNTCSLQEPAKRLLIYTEMRYQKQDCIAYLHELYLYFVEEACYELQKFILQDLAQMFQEAKAFEKENMCLRELLKLSR